MFSIVIPLYNKERQIVDTIKSIHNQTFQDFEIIVVNDGSTDKSLEQLNKIDDKRIRLINQSNSGVSSARNTGIEHAKYNYIAFLDADDRWERNYLEEQFNLIRKYPKEKIFSTSYYEIRNGNIYNPKVNGVDFKEDGILNYFYSASISDPIVCTITMVIKKDILLEMGGFPQNIVSGEDLITWAKLASKYQIVFSKKRLAVYIVENLKSEGTRIPDKVDFVGNELKKILSIYENKNDLKKYISFWHKIRFSMYLKFNMRKEALKEISISIKYHPRKYILYIFFILALLPKSLIDKIYNLKG